MDKLTMPKITLPKVGLSKCALARLGKDVTTEPRGTRNLLLNSDTYQHGDYYSVAQYDITKPELLRFETKLTLTLWGLLDENKDNWVIWSYPSDSSFINRRFNTVNFGDVKMYSVKFTAKNVSEPDTRIGISAWPAMASTLCFINQAKLELGWNDNPVWTPAPEDALGIPQTLELNDSDYGEPYLPEEFL